MNEQINKLKKRENRFIIILSFNAVGFCQTFAQSGKLFDTKKHLLTTY